MKTLITKAWKALRDPKKTIKRLNDDFREWPARTRLLIHLIHVWFLRKVLHKKVVLFERWGGLGDIICTFPSVLKLRERHPGAFFIYKVHPMFTPIVKMGRVVDGILEESWTGRRKYMETRHYDATYFPHTEEELRCGLDSVHLVDEFSRALDLKLVSRQPRLYPPLTLRPEFEKKLGEFRRKTKHLIGIQIGPSWRVREWPAASWEKLLQLLHAHFDCTVIQFGSDVHVTKGASKAPRISQCENWVGQLDLWDCARALQKLDLFIGIDSGLLHIAGAVGTASIGLFGPTNPQFRLPLVTKSIGVTAKVPCLGCHHRQPRLHWEDNCPNEIICMKELSPRAVYEAASEILQPHSARV